SPSLSLHLSLSISLSFSLSLSSPHLSISLSPSLSLSSPHLSISLSLSLFQSLSLYIPPILSISLFSLFSPSVFFNFFFLLSASGVHEYLYTYTHTCARYISMDTFTL